jgi:hypothetical protein
VIVAEDHRQPVLFAQRLHRLPHGGARFAAGGRGLGVLGRLARQAQGGLEGVLQALPGTAAPQAPAAGVDEDAIQPGVKGGVAPVGRQRAQGGQEGLLGGLVGLGRIVQDGQRETMERGLMGLHQRLNGGGVARPAALQPERKVGVCQRELDGGRRQNLHFWIVTG